MECQVVELNQETASNYKFLTLGPYQHHLDRVTAGDQQVFAAGLSFLGIPVGLALANRLSKDFAEISSLFVREDFRGRGYAGRLLEYLEETARKQGLRTLSIGYSSGNPYAARIELVIAKSGYGSPVVTSTIYRYSSKGVPEADYPWFITCDLPSLPKGVIKWQETTPEERQKLRNAAWFPDWLSPFKDEHLLEPLNSLAYRTDGEIAAWMVTHRLRSDTILYKSFYVREDLRNSGIAGLMMLKSIRLQFAEGITEYLLTIHNHNQMILPMVKRWMKGFGVSANEWKQAFKQL